MQNFNFDELLQNNIQESIEEANQEQSSQGTKNNDYKRVSIVITKEVHRLIKLQALKADVSMRDFIHDLILKNIHLD